MDISWKYVDSWSKLRHPPPSLSVSIINYKLWAIKRNFMVEKLKLLKYMAEIAYYFLQFFLKGSKAKFQWTTVINDFLVLYSPFLALLYSSISFRSIKIFINASCSSLHYLAGKVYTPFMKKLNISAKKAPTDSPGIVFIDQF